MAAVGGDEYQVGMVMAEEKVVIIYHDDSDGVRQKLQIILLSHPAKVY